MATATDLSGERNSGHGWRQRQPVKGRIGWTRRRRSVGKDGNVKAPAYTVGGKNYSSVSDAFAHVQAGTDNPYIKVHGKTEARNAAIWGIAIGSNAQTA